MHIFCFWSCQSKNILLSSCGCTADGKLLLLTFSACARILLLTYTYTHTSTPHTSLYYTLIFVKIVFEWNQRLVVSHCFSLQWAHIPNVPVDVPTSAETSVHLRFLLRRLMIWFHRDTVFAKMSLLNHSIYHFSSHPLFSYCIFNSSIQFIPFVSYVIIYSCNIVHTSKFFRCLQR